MVAKDREERPRKAGRLSKSTISFFTVSDNRLQTRLDIQFGKIEEVIEIGHDAFN